MFCIRIYGGHNKAAKRNILKFALKLLGAYTAYMLLCVHSRYSACYKMASMRGEALDIQEICSGWHIAGAQHQPFENGSGSCSSSGGS